MPRARARARAGESQSHSPSLPSPPLNRRTERTNRTEPDASLAQVRPGESVAIAGRTGAGKSSLLSALLRLHDFRLRASPPGRRHHDGHHPARPSHAHAHLHEARWGSGMEASGGRGFVALEELDASWAPLGALRGRVAVLPQARGGRLARRRRGVKRGEDASSGTEDFWWLPLLAVAGEGK